MSIADMAERASWRMHHIRRYATQYDMRKQEGKATRSKVILLRRRIAQLREWLSIIEDQLEREEKEGN
jgi:hypothetical protein